MIKTSPEARQILQILKSHNIQSLWHFTDIRNLPLIKKLNGLRSKESLEKEGYLTKIYCGGNELSHDLDRKLGNWDKISLNFTPHTPMAYHIKKEKHLVFIEIDISVATFEGVFFTDCNAIRLRNGQKREKGVKGLNNVKFQYIHSRPKPYDADWQKFVQAEILVPDHIPLDCFKKIHFISEASLQLGQYLWGTNEDLFNVSPQVFSDYNYSQGWVVLNPYVESVIITHQEVTKNNVGNNHIKSEIVEKGKDFWIKISLFATAGTEGKLILKASNDKIIDQTETSFEKESKWWWYPNFRIPLNYKHSSFIIEIFLEKVLWYKSRWRVT